MRNALEITKIGQSYSLTPSTPSTVKKACQRVAGEENHEKGLRRSGLRRSQARIQMGNRKLTDDEKMKAIPAIARAGRAPFACRHHSWRRSGASIFLVLACVFGIARPAPAAINVLSYWRMGENDSAAASGAAATGTVDSVGSNNLTFFGSAFYSNNVAVPAFAETGSSLSVNFSTPGTYGLADGLITGAQDNFGVEAWVNPAVLGANNQVIAYNGSTSTSGWGLFLAGSAFSALYGGQVVVEAGNATAGVWTHLALVRDSGVGTLYINGVASASFLDTPNPPAGRFAVGSDPQILGGETFTGLMDEVRVFTFAPGQFTTNDLLLNARNPVPANLCNVQSLGNGVVRFSFINNTNTTATFTVLSSTDLSLPVTNWTSVGVATNIATNLFEFTSPATPADAQRFYIIRAQ